ncbi:MAG: DUF503 domain-containing protein [Erysipelothrix sp.]|nr:DUF503 domain-containing protein [Erysipelothrix sp.]
MKIAVTKIVLHFDESFSLKDKRKLKNSLIDKVKVRFNVAISEVDTMDDIKTLTLGVSVVSNSEHHSMKMLNNVITFIEHMTPSSIIQVESDVIYFSD